MGSASATIINEQEWLVAMELSTFTCLSMALKAAVELDVLQIIANADDGLKFPLPLLYKIGKPDRLHGLTPLCKYLVQNNNGLSLVPLVVMDQENVFTDAWHYLKDGILDGSQPFTKANGVHAFERPAKDQRFNKLFNRAMAEHSILNTGRILESYESFKHLEELPHVVADAPQFQGVTHVGGDMFNSVSSGRAIFMKVSGGSIPYHKQQYNSRVMAHIVDIKINFNGEFGYNEIISGTQ
ncbi:hypothetical protein SUGI_1183850 [Cryptomeria japonica]|nr:hypothetical protein SUGI_1183850 [Cryptomeria japonica]